MVKVLCLLASLAMVVADVSEMTVALQVGVHQQLASPLAYPADQFVDPEGYALGAAGANECPSDSVPLTKDECVDFGAMAEANLGWKGYKGDVSRKRRPKGCYKCNSDGKSHFNDHYLGVGSAPHSVICKPSGPGFTDPCDVYDEGCLSENSVPIADAEDCEAYAACENHRWMWVKERMNRPFGCYICNNDGKTFFNPRTDGKDSPAHTKICKVPVP